MLRRNGLEGPSGVYAMAAGALRRREEELDLQLEKLAFAEAQLLTLAQGEAATSSGDATVEALAWGQAMVDALGERCMQAAADERATEEPWQNAMMVDAVQEEAGNLFASQMQTQVEEERKLLEEERRKAKAKAAADAAKDQAEIQALKLQGLNSRKLPLRPGFPPCGFYARKGSCKSGKDCVWDHPEQSLESNSKGYPKRPGLPSCALYLRTQTCKFGSLCMYDHPEPPAGAEPEDQYGMLPVSLAKVAYQQQQLQLQLHMQLSQEQANLQELDAQMTSWVRFRMTYCLNG